MSGSFGWYGPGVLIFKPDADLAAWDAIHGERLDRRQGPRREPAAGREDVAVHDGDSPEHQQRLSGRRCDRRLPQLDDDCLLQQGDGQALRRGRLLAEANQRRGAGERKLRLVRRRRADLQARRRPGAGTQYTASISTAAKDLAGNPLPVAKTWQFTTSTPPVVNSVSPADGATDVSPSSLTLAVFNKAMDKASAEGAFSLKRTSDGAPVSGSFGWYGAGVLIFKPDADLAAGTQYTASVSTAAKDLQGNTLANPVTWRYTTEASG